MKVIIPLQYDQILTKYPTLFTTYPYGFEKTDEGECSYELTVANYHHYNYHHLLKECEEGCAQFYQRFRKTLRSGKFEISPNESVKKALAVLENLQVLSPQYDEENSRLIAVRPLSRALRSNDPKRLAEGVAAYVAFQEGCEVTCEPILDEVPPYYCWYRYDEHHIETWKQMVASRSLKTGVAPTGVGSLKKYLRLMESDFWDIRYRNTFESKCVAPIRVDNPLSDEVICNCDEPCGEYMVSIDHRYALTNPRVYLSKEYEAQWAAFNEAYGLRVASGILYDQNGRPLLKYRRGEKSIIFSIFSDASNQ